MKPSGDLTVSLQSRLVSWNHVIPHGKNKPLCFAHGFRHGGSRIRTLQERMIFIQCVGACYVGDSTVKPVCNDHLYNKIYYLQFI